MPKKLDTINLTAKQILALLKGEEVKIGNQPIQAVNLDGDIGVLEDMQTQVDDLVDDAQEDEDSDEDDEENFDDDEDDMAEEDLEDEPE